MYLEEEDADALLLYIVTHDIVVLMGVDADMLFFGKAEVQNIFEDTMRLWSTGNSVDDMVRHRVIGPLSQTGHSRCHA